MTLLNVDEITTDLRCQSGRCNVLILNPLQVVVSQQWKRIVHDPPSRFVDCQWINERVMHRNLRSAEAIPARMGQLQTHRQPVFVPKDLPMCVPTTTKHRFDRQGRSVVQPELPRVHPGVRINRRCFAPDQLCSTRTKPAKPAIRQFIRRTLQGPIATFHRLDTEPISYGEGSDGNRLKQ